MAKSTVTISFDSEDAAAGWFRQARELGVVSDQAGLAQADVLDVSLRKALVGALVVTTEPGRMYVVKPPEGDSQ